MKSVKNFKSILDIREVEGEGGTVLVSDQPLIDIQDAFKVLYTFHGNILLKCQIFLDVEEADPSATALMNYMYDARDPLEERLGHYRKAGKNTLRDERRLEGIRNGENVYIAFWEYDEYLVHFVLCGQKAGGKIATRAMKGRDIFLFLSFQHIPTRLNKKIQDG